jgi:hypothetical protein
MTTTKLTGLQRRVYDAIGLDWIGLYEIHMATRWGQRGCSRDVNQLVRVMDWLEKHGFIESESGTDRVKRVRGAK